MNAVKKAVAIIILFLNPDFKDLSRLESTVADWKVKYMSFNESQESAVEFCQL